MNLKVLHVVSISFSLKYFIGNQFSFFAKRGVDYSVSCSDSVDLHNYAQEMGFRAFPVKIKRNISPLTDMMSIIKLARYMRKEKFDLVIAHTPKGGLIGIIAAVLAGVPKRIYFRHGLVFETATGFKRKMLIAVEKFVSFFSHKIVNVSKSIMIESERFRLNAKAKNILLGNGTCNGVDTIKFRPSPDKSYDPLKFTLGFVGRLCRDKGLIELIEAWEIISSKYLNAKLLLVGPLDARDPLPQSTLDKILKSKSIDFRGEVDNVAEVYGEMDVFILPSYREGFPTVTLEASSSGLPIITTRKTGCVDSIVEFRTGIFTNITSQSIAKAVEFYIDNPKLISEYGYNGRQWVKENFAEPVVYQEIEEKIMSV